MATYLCKWILGPNKEQRWFCGDPVSYKMVPDGGEPGAPKVRKYNTFCDKHMKAAAIEDANDNSTD